MRPVTPSFPLSRQRGLAWWVAFFLLVLFVGLRQDVGGDWAAYWEYVERQKGVPLADFAVYGDPAYELLNWLGANVWGGVYVVNFLSAILFVYGLLTFAQIQPRQWLAVAIAVPYLVVVVGMGYTRQAVAIGLAMMAISALMQGSFHRFLAWMFVAALFHKSALVLVPMAIFSGSKRPLVTLFGVALTTALLFFLLLKEALDGLVANYIEAEYNSGGAAFRVAMNAIPAIIFLLFNKRFVLSEAHRRYWRWMSLSALAFVLLLVVSPSSTAVDRVALYWIPLQLFVLARVPDAMGKHGGRNAPWVMMVVLYCSAVCFVWLNFASHAFAWLPYRFLPFELISEALFR